MADGMIIRDVEPHDIAWITRVHQQHYSQVEGFDEGFNDAVSSAIERFYSHQNTLIDRAFLLQVNQQPAGCLFCQSVDTTTARLKLFFLDAPLRGKGLGRDLLNHALQHIRAAGRKKVLVSTYSAHEAACALYRRSGFSVIEEKAVKAYGRQLTEQSWLYTF